MSLPELLHEIVELLHWSSAQNKADAHQAVDAHFDAVAEVPPAKPKEGTPS